MLYIPACSCGSARVLDARRARPVHRLPRPVPGAVHHVRARTCRPRTRRLSADNPPEVVARPADAWPQAPAGFKVQLYADGLDEPAPAPRRAERRSVRRREQGRRRARAARPRRRRARPCRTRCSRRGLNAAVRHRVLSRRAANRAGSTSPTPTRSCASPTRTAICRRAASRRSIVAELPGGGLLARRRPLDARHRLLARRQEDVRLGRARARTSTTPTPRPAELHRADILEFDARRRRHARLRLGHPQRGRHRRAAAHRRAVGLGQRARRPGRRPGARLHHPRQGGRLLRLALVLHRRQPGPAPRRQAPRAEATRSSSPTCCCSRTSRRCRWPSTTARSSRRRTAATSSPPSTARGTAAPAPATRSFACRCTARTRPSGEYEDFLTGFVTADGEVWGRPVGVAVGGGRRAARQRRRRQLHLARQLSGCEQMTSDIRVGRGRACLEPSPSREVRNPSRGSEVNEVEVECPFCGEPGEIAADYNPSEPGDQEFVQDCAVCCRPWTVVVHVSPDGEVTFDVGRD